MCLTQHCVLIVIAAEVKPVERKMIIVIVFAAVISLQVATGETGLCFILLKVSK